jgi:hypothetical protein
MRMCTACYSKMQREKKKGETGCNERPSPRECEVESQFSVRGARHASAAARKFIEEFARNKGGWDSAVKQEGTPRRENGADEQVPANSQGTVHDGTVLLSVPTGSKGNSEELFHVGHSHAAFVGVGLAGARIIKRDPQLASNRTMRYMTDRSRSHTGIGDEPRQRTFSPDGPYPLAAPKAESSHAQSHHLDGEDPNVIQGAEDLMLLMKPKAEQVGLQFTTADSMFRHRCSMARYSASAATERASRVQKQSNKRQAPFSSSTIPSAPAEMLGSASQAPAGTAMRQGLSISPDDGNSMIECSGQLSAIGGFAEHPYPLDGCPGPVHGLSAVISNTRHVFGESHGPPPRPGVPCLPHQYLGMNSNAPHNSEFS